MNGLFLLIGIGGFIGTVLRYSIQQIVSNYFPSTLPIATFIVNITGCFLVGLIFGLSEKGNLLPPEWRLFLATGFCGGFTTFSTFSYESLQLVRDGQWVHLLLYVCGSVILGFIATFLGVVLIKSL